MFPNDNSDVTRSAALESWPITGGATSCVPFRAPAVTRHVVKLARHDVNTVSA